jgi:CO/xanthine dehydrogenase Mo-binding subunit
MAIAEPRDETRIGVSRPRPDSREKVTGLIRFEADRPHMGLLHARLVPSLYAHSRIRGIDASEALALPGVVAVLTAADLPIKHRDDMRMFEPLARSETVFAGPAGGHGHRRVGDDRRGRGRTRHDRRGAAARGPRPRSRRWCPASPSRAWSRWSTTSTWAATPSRRTRPSAARAPPWTKEELSDNVAAGKRYADGDVAAAFAASDHVVEGTFNTSWVYQGYLEPHTATAWMDPDGTLRVESSTQGTFYARKQLAKIYGLPLARIRVKGAPLGGAFGSKLLVVDPLVAGAALKLRRPDPPHAHAPGGHPRHEPAPGSTIQLRIGARADGTLTGIDARSCSTPAPSPSGRSRGSRPCSSRTSTAGRRSTSGRTASARTGSGRARTAGPGGPQAFIAIESLIDELAAKVGIDPSSCRQRNLVAEGDPMVDGETWPKIGAAQVLARPPRTRCGAIARRSPRAKGVGLSLGVWPGGKEPAAAICRLNSDGTLTVATGIVDMSGTTGTFALIAAEEFGLPVRRRARREPRHRRARRSRPSAAARS